MNDKLGTSKTTARNYAQAFSFSAVLLIIAIILFAGSANGLAVAFVVLSLVCAVVGVIQKSARG